MIELTKKLEPTILVIFGITGDLSQRYLLPSLYQLMKNGLLDDSTEIVGVTRGETSAEELFEKVELCVNEINKTCDPVILKSMRQQTSMFRMDLDQPDDYDALLKKINSIEDEKGVCMNRLYYLSIPPKAYGPVINLLGEKNHNKTCQHGEAVTRLLVEKPFGFDLESARTLIDDTAKVFKEEQVFRIDHYMAKEAVQNILTFRFQNPIFESIWNNQHIASIEISAREKLGIEGRAVFYEPLGALRDFIQNHLIQIMGIITMDKPAALDSQSIHSNKQAVLDQVKIMSADQVEQHAVRGQYKGYRDEVENQRSNTETFAALEVNIDSARWQGVPIKLLTGKALNTRKTEISINFHGGESESKNQLRFRIQPNEGIELDLVTKQPGYDYITKTVPMDFSYKKDFPEHSLPDAYERVLVDAIRGDRSLFATSQEVLASWRIVQPVLESWADNGDGLIVYDRGSAGLTLKNHTI